MPWRCLRVLTWLEMTIVFSNETANAEYLRVWAFEESPRMKTQTNSAKQKRTQPHLISFWIWISGWIRSRVLLVSTSSARWNGFQNATESQDNWLLTRILVHKVRCCLWKLSSPLGWFLAPLPCVVDSRDCCMCVQHSYWMKVDRS